MKFKNIFSGIAAAALTASLTAGGLLMASTSNAATVISFETDEAGFASVGSVAGTNTGGAPVAVSNSGFDFTLDADTFTTSGPNLNLNNELNIEITQNDEGIGIDNNNGFLGADSAEIDGAGSNDIFIFSFANPVELFQVIFENVTGNDDFVFFLPGASPEFFEADIVNPLPFPDTDGDEGFFDFGGLVVSTFGIGAQGANDNFRISSIEVAAVPLPAALPLMGAGLAAFGFIGWRKKRKAA